MILIYSQHKSTRLNYIFDFVFKAKYQNYLITQCIDEFKASSETKINYSSLDLNADLTIIPEGLLFEKTIRDSINVTFNASDENWRINDENDPLSIIFFFLTCYEEYYIKERDEHERFSAKNSSLSKNNRLHKPNADLIVMQIWDHLKLDYIPIQKKYKSIITFDIDSAWAIKNKSRVRSIGSDIKSFLKRESTSSRRAIRSGSKADPFDTFDTITEVSKKSEVICFFLLGNWGSLDKNINWKNEHFRYLINDLATKLTIGIHPSYKSYLSPNLIKKELERLNKITNLENTRSRQHFLKLELPKSYEILEEIGIKEDYSMGFADAYGFRAGTSFPFRFFNLSKGTISNLTVYPISYMDGTLNQYLKLSIEDSAKVVKKLKSEIKNTGGIFIPLWHNETINNEGSWRGWMSVFESNFDD